MAVVVAADAIAVVAVLRSFHSAAAGAAVVLHCHSAVATQAQSGTAGALESSRECSVAAHVAAAAGVGVIAPRRRHGRRRRAGPWVRRWVSDPG